MGTKMRECEPNNRRVSNYQTLEYDKCVVIQHFESYKFKDHSDRIMYKFFITFEDKGVQKSEYQT